MMKKLALLLAMSGVSFVANSAETLMIEATYQEPLSILRDRTKTPGKLSTIYEATCKIYDSGKAIVSLNKYDYDNDAAQAAIQAANYTDIDKNQFKKNSKTIILTSTVFKVDKTFLKDAVNEAVLAEATYLSLSEPDSEFFVYKNKKKMKLKLSGVATGTEVEAEKLNIALKAMCNQHGMRQAVTDCGIPGSC